ncbi:MAG: anhydro-N-acetylmuramic acid kinase, partial [Marinilabiliales bacterium]
MKNYRAVGIMSGTSLDGLDIVLCNFTYNNVWSFQIEKSLTIKYSKDWQTKLSSAPSLSGYELTLLDKEYGRFIGNSVKDFLTNCTSPIDVIASHGHTVFHQPNKKLTLQIGNGQEIAIATGIKTICNFRSLDVALGGQGAPLVPVGDQFLFPEYDFCMNIGGFANISFDDKGKRVAYDIGPANIVLNYLANKLGHPIDKNGALGFLGKSDDQLLNELNSLSYYSLNRPKSLGKEWLEQIFLPILNRSNLSIHNQLKTVYEHI